MSNRRRFASPAPAVRRGGAAVLAAAMVAALGLIGLAPGAQAAPLPAPYAATAGGTILGVSSTLVGSTLVGTDIGRSTATATSSSTPNAQATGSNLGLRLGPIGVADTHTTTAPPNRSESGSLLAVGVPGLLGSGVLSYATTANWGSTTACVTNTVSSSTTSTVGASVSAVIPVLSTGAASTTTTTALVPQSAFHDTRAVRSTAAGSVAGLSLLNGAIQVSALQPSLSATATSGVAAASVLTGPAVTASVLGGPPVTLTPGADVGLSVPLVGSVTLHLASNAEVTASAGTFSVTYLTAAISVLGSLGTVSVNLLPLSVSATAPAGGVECDTTAPTLAVTAPAAGSTVRTTTPTIAGTSDVLSGTVSVAVDGGAALTVPTAADGSWSLTSPTLSEASHTVTVSATDAASNTGTTSSTFVVDVLPQLAITGPPNEALTTDARPAITGTSSATNGTVQVAIDGGAATPVTTAGNGTWTFTPSAALSEARHTVVASAVDAQGNPVSATSAFTVDTTAPALAITAPATGTTVATRAPVVTGTSDQAARTVSVSVDGGAAVPVTTDSGGGWSLPLSGLTETTHTVTATITDPAGNPATASTSFVVDVTGPTIAVTAPAAGSTITTRTPAVTGTSNVAAGPLSLTVDGGPATIVTTAADGSWTLPATAPLADGSHTIVASATDAVGNPGSGSTTFQVDATAPTLAVLTPADGSTTNSTTPTYSGTSDEHGRPMTVEVDGGPAVPTTTSATGTWAVTQTPALPPGPHTVVATIHDAAGNTTTASSSFTVDTSSPAIAVTSPVADSSTRNATPTISGTSDQPGRSVTVTVGSTSLTTTAGPDGSWSVTPSAPLPDRTYPVTATVTNVAGTSSTATSSFTVDTTAPAIRIVTPADASVTNATQPVISGTSDVLGGIVSVQVDSAAPVDVPTDPSGGWTTAPAAPLSATTHTVTVRSTDAAGNVGLATSSFTIDTTAPVVGITSPADGTTTSNPIVSVSGTSDLPGGLVSVSIDGAAPVTTTAGPDGSWALPPRLLGEGPHTVQASATDPAGNTGSATTHVTVDTTAPVVTIATPADGSVTDDTTPTIAGTTSERGGLVHVSVDGAPSQLVTADLLTGAWTLTPTTPLSATTHQIDVSVTDAGGNTGAAHSTFSIDVTPPAVSVVTPADGSTVGTARPTVSGTSDQPGVVEVAIDGGVPVAVLTDSGGGWTLPLTTNLGEGSHVVAVSATDPAGNTGRAQSSFTVDTVAPVVTIDRPVDGSSTNAVRPTISGTSDVHTGQLRLLLDAGPAVSVPTDAAGAWTFVPTADLAAAPHTVTVSATDLAGNTGSDTASFTVDLTAPAIAIVTPANASLTNDASPAISGTSDQPHAAVSVTVDGGGPAVVVADAQGRWSSTPSTPLAEGPHDVVATVSDAAGNLGDATSTFTVDLTAPVLAVTAPARGARTNDTTPTISGTSDALGATVTVVLDLLGAPLTAVVQPDGTWSVTPTTPLLPGPHVVAASVRDEAGNETSADTDFVVDVTAPLVTVLTPPNGSTTTSRTPAISGATTEPLGTVLVSIDAAAPVATTADAAGLWSLTPASLGDGPHTVVASSTDAAGNTGQATSTFTVDATPPGVEITAPADGSTTNDRTPDVNGTTDALGATVVVTVDGVPSLPVTASPTTGAWTVPGLVALGDGPHTAIASVSDPAGNVGTATSTFTVDATAPEISIAAPADGSSTNDSTPTISGQTDGGATVTVTIDGSPVGTTQALPSGLWSFTTTVPLADTVHHLTASVTDGAGNTGTAVSDFAVDTTAPAVAVTSPASGSSINVTRPTVRGTSSITGGSIALQVDGGAAITVPTDAGGGWSTDLATPLGDGPHTVTATATDAVGNVGTATSGFTVDTAPPTVTIGSPADGSVTADTTPVVSGASSILSGTVAVSIDGAPAIEAPTDAAGNWTTVWTTALDDGQREVTATAVDEAGNSAVATSDVTIDTVAPVVTITSPSSGSTTTDASPQLVGSSDQPGSVIVSIDGGPGTATTVSPSGDWTLTPSTPLTDGPHSATVTATDPAGNTGTATTSFSVDTTPPAIAVTAPATGSTTGTNTVDVSGTTDQPGAIVTVAVDSTTPVTVTASATDGSWSLPGVGPLSEGTHTVTATVDDAAGNTGTATSTFTVDTTAPVVAITTPVAGSTINTPAAPITGTSNQAGTVTVDVDGTMTVVPVQPDGSWSLTPTPPLSDGPHTVVVSATDPVGNIGTAESDFVVDATGPAIAIVEPAAGSATNDPTPRVSGTSDQSDAAVQVSVDGGTAMTVTTAPDGSWVLPATSSLVDGDHAVTATTSDPTGNASTATVVFTVDTSAPDITVLTPVDGSTVSDPTPEVSGTSGIPGGTVTVQIDATEPVTVPTTSAGDWSDTPTTPLLEGPHTVDVSGSDAAGNIGRTRITFTLRHLAPELAITQPADGSSTNETMPTVSGTSSVPDSTVTLHIGAGPVFTADTDADGMWSTTAPTALPEGSYTVSASVTDDSGATATAESSFTVDLTPPVIDITRPRDLAVLNNPRPTIRGTSNVIDGVILLTDTTTPSAAPAPRRLFDVSHAPTLGAALRTAALPLGSGVEVPTNASGAWSYTPTVAYAVGQHSVLATAEDEAGNSAQDPTTFRIVAKAAVAITSPLPGEVVTDPTPTVTGTATGDEVIDVVVDGGTPTPVSVSDGTWTFDVTTPLPVGDHTVTVSATDPAGGTATASVSFTVATPRPVIRIITPLPGTTTTDPTPTFGGTSSGSTGTVTVTIDGVAHEVTVTNGRWTYTPTAALSCGTHTVTVTDGAASATSTFSVACSSSAGSALPRTGATSAVVVAWALALIGMGMLLSRRRRRS